MVSKLFKIWCVDICCQMVGKVAQMGTIAKSVNTVSEEGSSYECCVKRKNKNLNLMVKFCGSANR